MTCCYRRTQFMMFARSSKPSGRSSGYWWRRRLLLCKRRCATRPQPPADIALYETPVSSYSTLHALYIVVIVLNDTGPC